jgi:hypothetical protein
VDPSGHDPLDAAWQSQFYAATGRSPDAVDILIRLFSIAFPAEWNYDTFYDADGNYNLANVETLLRDGTRRDWNDMPGALQRLAGWYNPATEEEAFVRDVGTLFGGYLNRHEQPEYVYALWGVVDKNTSCPPPCRVWAYLGPGGIHRQLIGGDDDANVHHWAFGFMLGYRANPVGGIVLSSGREVMQALGPGAALSVADVWLGNRGAMMGGALSSDLYSVRHIRRLFNAMQVNRAPW